jgi:hypothetical protein
MVWRTAVGSMLVLCGLVGGCSTDPVSLDHQFALEATDSPAANPCFLHLIGVRDARRTAELGRVAGRRVNSGDILAWLTQGLEQIGVRLDDNSDSSTPSLDVEVVLLTAHARSVHTSMCCDVVLEATFLQKQQTVASKRYRGSCTQINWASGTDEIHRCFDLALRDALAKLHEHALAVCSTCYPSR